MIAGRIWHGHRNNICTVNEHDTVFLFYSTYLHIFFVSRLFI